MREGGNGPSDVRVGMVPVMYVALCWSAVVEYVFDASCTVFEAESADVACNKTWWADQLSCRQEQARLSATATLMVIHTCTMQASCMQALCCPRQPAGCSRAESSSLMTSTASTQKSCSLSTQPRLVALNTM